MRTLKRIGLFLLLKVLEVGGLIGLAFLFIYLTEKFRSQIIMAITYLGFMLYVILILIGTTLKQR